MNNVNLIGRMTRDAEIRYTATTNKMVAAFTLAVDKRNEGTNFFNCEAWGKTAEIIQKYTAKGRQIAVYGELDNDVYESNGKNVTRTKIVVREVTLLGKREDKTENVDFTQETAVDNVPVFGDDDDLPF